MITAALPTYNNSAIIWLQLTALCNQVDTPEWELIVCEEKSENTFGFDGLKDWEERLKKANCKRVVYLSLDKWIPLGQKWITIRDHMSKDSVGMMLCASDNYSSSNRIKDSYNAMVEGNDWFQTQSGYFYNILADKAGKFQATETQPGLFMCASKKSLDRVNESYFPKKGVDTWLMRVTRPESKQLNEWTNGVHMDGYNTISHNRRLLYTKDAIGMFEPADENEVFGLFPKGVQERLKDMKK